MYLGSPHFYSIVVFVNLLGQFHFVGYIFNEASWLTIFFLTYKSRTFATINKANILEKQPNNPLHGITLATIVEKLEEYYSWEVLADKIPIRCFDNNPSIKSSLKFLRKTPWARAKVEALYIRTFSDSE